MDRISGIDGRKPPAVADVAETVSGGHTEAAVGASTKALQALRTDYPVDLETIGVDVYARLSAMHISTKLIGMYRIRLG